MTTPSTVEAAARIKRILQADGDHVRQHVRHGVPVQETAAQVFKPVHSVPLMLQRTRRSDAAVRHERSSRPPVR